MPDFSGCRVVDRDTPRLTFEEYLHLSGKISRAERLLPYEMRALERDESVRHLLRRPVQRVVRPNRR
jgi:hypothetical protein